ncbi:MULTISPECIES: hypothetical protein, partial [unclassified Bradyrhizobium]|uniref:hypothetical protein n=1 Tax=unclassified Bradyrhizobium TaxID=2631580 RepID=UPI001FFBC265
LVNLPESKILAHSPAKNQTRPSLTSDYLDRLLVYAGKYGPIPNSGHRSLRLASVVQPDRFRTTDVRASALNA